MGKHVVVSILCAWVIWLTSEGKMPEPLDSYEKLAPCDSEAMRLSSLSQKIGKKGIYVCLPDTIDPRPRK
jgi:hypothetical protein